MSLFESIKPLVPAGIRQRVRSAQVKRAIVHLRGPARVDVGPTEAVVTCVVKNGAFYVDQFVTHYLGLGFKHIFFLDNGSTDDTIERASRHSHVSVFHSEMAVGSYQGLLKRHLAELTVPSGWCLDVDIDEFFDYPHSESLSLARLLEYLNRRHFTAVLTQMLDMFSDRPLSSLRGTEPEDLKKIHRFYDISNVRRSRYGTDPLTVLHAENNKISHPHTHLHWGGIRQTIYGIDVCLTKHSLFRTGVGLNLFPHVHYVDAARLADVSAVLLHYKFSSNALDEAARNSLAFVAIREDYEQILDTMGRCPDLLIKTATSSTFSTVTALLENDFVFASDEFKSLATAQAAMTFHPARMVQGLACPQ